MSPKKKKQSTITVALSSNHKRELERLAMRFGATWGDFPNVSRLLRDIAEGKILLHTPQSPFRSEDKRKHFEAQVQIIKDAIARLESL